MRGLACCIEARRVARPIGPVCIANSWPSQARLVIEDKDIRHNILINDVIKRG